MPSTKEEYALFDAGVFIGALLTGDSRHTEARPLVEAARRGDLLEPVMNFEHCDRKI
jgi:predicted nucleic acid-binding protein